MSDPSPDEVKFEFECGGGTMTPDEWECFWKYQSFQYLKFLDQLKRVCELPEPLENVLGCLQRAQPDVPIDNIDMVMEAMQKLQTHVKVELQKIKGLVIPGKLTLRCKIQESRDTWVSGFPT